MGEQRQQRADQTWNRACEAMASGLPPHARTGDVLLLRAIALDGEVHNAGLLNRVENEEDLYEAIEALRWFGLLEAVARIEQVRDQWRRLADQGWPQEAVDELENEADRLYFEMPQGEVTDQLTAALLTRLDDDPDAFSPI